MLAQWRLLNGDCREVLATLPDRSVHCCVTSPPYWGLRDYGTATWIGGSEDCDHLGPPMRTNNKPSDPTATFHGGSSRSTEPWKDGVCGRCGASRVDSQLGLEATPEEYVSRLVDVFREVRRVLRDDGTLWLNLGDSYAANHGGAPGDTIGTDGHARNNRRERKAAGVPLGLKPKDLVGIPWMVARALRAPFYTGKIRDERDRAWLAGWMDGEGTISFVERNRGEGHTPTHDARVYITNTDRGPLAHFAGISGGHVYVHDDGTRENRYGSRECYRWQMGTHDGALVLRELYPYLRTKRRQAALVWTLYTTLRHKNGHARTPESVVARRREIADMIRSLNAGGDVTLPSWVEEPPSPTEPGWYLRSDIVWAKANPMPESVEDRPTKAHEYVFLLAKSERYFYDADAIREPHKPESLARYEYGLHVAANPNAIPGSLQDLAQAGIGNSGRMGDFMNPSGRNRRTVWTLASEPFSEAHFATFPTRLVEPCILAATSANGCCSTCGAPMERVVEVERGDTEAAERPKRTGGMASPTSTLSLSGNGSREWAERGPKRRDAGWAPTCDCGSDTVPCTVLEPFAGSGTVGVVALRHGRSFIGIDLNPAYVEMARRRIRREAPALLVEETA